MLARTFLLLLALLASTAVAARDWQLQGRVVDEAGAPVPAAKIRTSQETLQTDANGRFVASAADDAVITLQVAAEGFYESVQTFHASDFPDAAAASADLVVVARQPDRRLLVFAGDAMLARRYFEPRADEPVLVRRGHVREDGERLLDPIRDYIEIADYASVNVETQLSSGTLSDRLPKSVTFWSPPELADTLAGAGFDYAALGNNHSWDFQAEGLTPTIEALRAAGLDYSGAGFDERGARRPARARIDGAPYAFLSYVGWAGLFTPSQAADADKGGAALGGTRQFREDLAALAPDEVAVLQYHSGLEYEEMPAGSERLRLRQAVAGGADIAIGHHPHVLQGFEIHRGRLIAYSLGNFLFDQYHYTTQLGMLLYVWMDGDELHRAEVVPVNINGYVPTPAIGQFRYAVLHRLARLSRPFGTCLRQSGAHAVIEPCEDLGARAPQVVDIGDIEPTTSPVHLAAMGLAATQPVAFRTAGHAYRLGTDILRRGDFESSGLHGTRDRSWIDDERISVVDNGSRQLQLVVPRRGTLRAGMKVFERVYSRSAPTTFRGRIRADADVVVNFMLQRRRMNDSLGDALENGPLKSVGALRLGAGGWRDFAIDFDQPRVSTRSVRLLIDVRDASGRTGGATVHLDDLAWVEWRTPWLDGDGRPDQASFATHVQFGAGL